MCSKVIEQRGHAIWPGLKINLTNWTDVYQLLAVIIRAKFCCFFPVATINEKTAATAVTDGLRNVLSLSMLRRSRCFLTRHI